MTTTRDLAQGTRVAVPPTLSSSGFTATVQRVEPWMLSAGPRAGQQATNGRGGKGDPLFTVVLADVVVITPPQQPRGMSDVARLVDASPVRHHVVTADDNWAVL